MARRLRHGMSVACHCSRWRRRCSNSSGKAESSATTLSGRPRWAIAAPMTSLLPTWAGGHDDPARGRLVADALERRRVERLHERDDLVLRHERDAHQLDEVAAVFAVRAQGDPPDPRMIRRQPQHVPEVPVGPGPLGRPQEVGGLRPEPQHRPGRTGRQRAQQPGDEAVAEDGRPLHDPRTRAAGSVRRLESSSGGHRAAVATLALVPAIRLTVFLTGASVPSRVSLSSPRMNASTRLKAMSSWIWIGGLFMK